MKLRQISLEGLWLPGGEDEVEMCSGTADKEVNE